MGMGMGLCCCGDCRWVSAWAPVTHNGARIEHHLFYIFIPFTSLDFRPTATCSSDLRRDAISIGQILLIYSHDDELTDTHVFMRVPASATVHPEIECVMRISRSVVADYLQPFLGGVTQPTFVKIRAIESLEVYRGEERFAWVRDLDAPFPYREQDGSVDRPGARLLQTAGCRCQRGRARVREELLIHINTVLSPRILDHFSVPVRTIVSADGGQCELFSSDNLVLAPGGGTGGSTFDGWAVIWQIAYQSVSVPDFDWFGAPVSRSARLQAGIVLDAGVYQDPDPILAQIGAQLQVFGGFPAWQIFLWLLASAANTMTPLNSVWDNNWFPQPGQSGPGGPCASIDAEVSQP